MLNENDCGCGEVEYQENQIGTCDSKAVHVHYVGDGITCSGIETESSCFDMLCFMVLFNFLRNQSVEMLIHEPHSTIHH